jgi:hypothetical protein
VGVALPIFTRHRAGVALEQATLTQLTAARDATLARVTGEVAGAAALADAQRAQYLRYRDQIVPQALEVERLAEDSYRLGQTGIGRLSARAAKLARRTPPVARSRGGVPECAVRPRTRRRRSPAMIARASWLAASVVVVAALLAGCSRPAPEEVESETVVPVTTEPAQRGSVRAIIHATGTITPAPGADLIVIAPEAARIAEIPKAEGDRVGRGDLLVRFEIPSLTADIATRRAEVARADARLANARAAQTRAHDLFDRGIAARREVEESDGSAPRRKPDWRARGTLAADTAAAVPPCARHSTASSRPAHNPATSSSRPPATSSARHRSATLEVSASIPLADISACGIGARCTTAGVPAKAGSR